MMSPKSRFLTSPDRVAQFRSTIVQPWFLDAIDAAMLQYGNNIDAESSADVSSGVKLKGAREFVRVLMTLTDQPTVTPRRDLDNLPNR